MKRYIYRFDTLQAFVEEVSGLKVGRNGAIIGVNLDSALRDQFGMRAQRHYPFGYLFVMPGGLPSYPFNEVPEELEWEPEPDLIFRRS